MYRVGWNVGLHAGHVVQRPSAVLDSGENPRRPVIVLMGIVIFLTRVCPTCLPNTEEKGVLEIVDLRSRRS